MIGVLERKGQSYGDTERLRKPFMDESDVEKGRQLRSTIYSTAGNAGIFALMDKYFPDLCESWPSTRVFITSVINDDGCFS